MTTLSLTSLRQQLSAVVNKAAYGKQRTVVAKNGKPAFAVVPIDDLRTLVEHEEMEDRFDNAEADKALAEGDFMELKDFLKEMHADAV